MLEFPIFKQKQTCLQPDHECFVQFFHEQKSAIPFRLVLILVHPPVVCLQQTSLGMKLKEVISAPKQRSKVTFIARSPALILC